MSEAFGAWSGDYRRSQNREWVQAGSPPARDKGVSGLVSEAEKSRGIQEGAEGTCFIHSFNNCASFKNLPQTID